MCTAQVCKESHQTIIVGHCLIGRRGSYEVWSCLLHRNLNGLNFGLIIFWEDQWSRLHTRIHIHITHKQINLKKIKMFLFLTQITSIILHQCHYSFQPKTNPLMITLPSWAITIFLCCSLQQKSSNCLYKSCWWCFLSSLIALLSSRSLMGSIVLTQWSVSVFITPDPWATPSI